MMSRRSNMAIAEELPMTPFLNHLLNLDMSSSDPDEFCEAQSREDEQDAVSMITVPESEPAASSRPIRRTESGLEFPFVDLVEDFRHATPAEQMATQQLKEECIATRRSRACVATLRSRLARRQQVVSKESFPMGLPPLRKKSVVKGTFLTPPTLATKGFVADAKAAGFGSEGIDDGPPPPSNQLVEDTMKAHGHTAHCS